MAHNKVKDRKNQRSNDQAWNRGHEKPFPVSGKMMVIAMHDVNELFGSFTVSHPMEGKPVHQILKKGPKEHPTQKNKGNGSDPIIQGSIAKIKEIDNNRQVYAPDHQGMRFGEHFQVVIPK